LATLFMGQVEGKMTRWGVGPRFAAASLAYSAVAAGAQHLLFPGVRFVIFAKSANMALGTALAAAGLFIFLVPALTIDRYYNQGLLCRKGIYARMRHPIYGAWISFIVPGIVVMAGSVMGITIPVFMYVVFRALIPEEERYLAGKFGDEYAEYQASVWAVFPKLW